MNKENFILLDKICVYHNVEKSFFINLNEMGLIEIITIEQFQYIHHDKIAAIEKMIRMHHELNVNLEGIDIVLNLLQKIEDLQNELIAAKN